MLAEVLEQQSRAPDAAAGFRDALARDVGRGAVNRFEQPRDPVPGWTFALAAMPMPPWIAAARSVRMSPNRFDATTTSRLSGLRTIRAASASTSTRS